MLAEKLLGCAILLLLSTMARSCGTNCYPPLRVSDEAPSTSAENRIIFARCHTACVDKVRFCYAFLVMHKNALLWLYVCVFLYVCVCVCVCLYCMCICIRMTSMPCTINLVYLREFFLCFCTHTFTHLDYPWFILSESKQFYASRIAVSPLSCVRVLLYLSGQENCLHEVKQTLWDVK